jgi:hypothetical protein
MDHDSRSTTNTGESLIPLFSNTFW